MKRKKYVKKSNDSGRLQQRAFRKRKRSQNCGVTKSRPSSLLVGFELSPCLKICTMKHSTFLVGRFTSLVTLFCWSLFGVSVSHAFTLAKSSVRSVDSLSSSAFIRATSRGQKTRTSFKNCVHEYRVRKNKDDLTAAFLLAPAVASVVAGSVAGAIGVGVAFPFDTLKTKAQVISRQRSDSGGSSAMALQKTEENINMLQLIALVWKTDGIAGFFGGVRAMMVGNAIIKSLAFSANAIGLSMLQTHTEIPDVLALLMAACFSGFVTSFVAAPIERIKVMMQASSGIYKNEIECFQAILRTEGLKGFMGRGLGATLAREVPSYGIYFWFYGVVINSALATALGPVAPLVFGALAGMVSWLPVYPVDVVKVRA